MDNNWTKFIAYYKTIPPINDVKKSLEREELRPIRRKVVQSEGFPAFVFETGGKRRRGEIFFSS